MTWIQHAGRRGIATLATALAAACGDGDNNGPAGNSGSIQLSVTPATLTLQQGATGSVNATLARSGGFTGAVNLAISGLPTGVTTTIAPTQLSGAATGAVVDVAVATAVAPGTYTATITAAAEGVSQASATYQLTVTAAPAFTLAVTPSALTVTQGGSGVANVALGRTNMSGAIALSFQSPQAGITGALAPASTTDSTSVLTITVGATVPAGVYQVSVRGNATGLTERAASVQVTVAPPPAGGNTVEYQFCDPSFVPVFVAFQDGTGNWQQVVATTSGAAAKFAFTLTQPRGGVLFVYSTTSSIVGRTSLAGARRESALPRLSTRRTGSLRTAAIRQGTGSGARTLKRSSREDLYWTELLFASTTELVQDAAESCVLTQPTKAVFGTVVGVTAGQYSRLSLGDQTHLFNGTSTNPVVVFDVPIRVADLVASRLPSAGAAPDKAVVMRNVDVPSLSTLPSPIDFNGPHSSVPASASVTISGGGGDRLEVYTEVVTVNGRGLFWNDIAPSTNAIRIWAGLNAATMLSSDYHGLVVFADAPNNTGDFRVTLKYVGAVSDQTVAMGAAIGPAAVSPVATGSYPRFRFQGTLPADYNKSAIDVYGEERALRPRHSPWLAGPATLAYDITMPDVAGLPASPPSRLTAGIGEVSTSGSLQRQRVFDLRPELGREFKSAVRSHRSPFLRPTDRARHHHRQATALSSLDR
jgi:hypothetical protein